MEERILSKSVGFNIKKTVIIIWSVCAVLFMFIFVIGFVKGLNEYKDYVSKFLRHSEYKDGCGIFGEWYCLDCQRLLRHSGRIGFALHSCLFDFSFNYVPRFFVFLAIIVVALIIGLIYLWLRSYELTITDKRAYGKTAWGKRVDLPLDSISAVGVKWPKGISVGTSSGRISFLLIKNRDEIHKCVSELLIERQSKVTSNATATQKVSHSSAGELKEYKDLLDSGIITQEEFDAKKKQLLGL